MAWKDRRIKWFHHSASKSKPDESKRITSLIKAIVAREKKDPYFINCGDCETVAMEVTDAIPEAELVWLEDEIDKDVAHAVVRYRGKYYDAEVPEGVTSIRDIPVVKHYGDSEYHRHKHENRGKLS